MQLDVARGFADVVYGKAGSAREQGKIGHPSPGAVVIADIKREKVAERRDRGIGKRIHGNASDFGHRSHIVDQTAPGGEGEAGVCRFSTSLIGVAVVDNAQNPAVRRLCPDKEAEPPLGDQVGAVREVKGQIDNGSCLPGRGYGAVLRENRGIRADPDGGDVQPVFPAGERVRQQELFRRKQNAVQNIDRILSAEQIPVADRVGKIGRAFRRNRQTADGRIEAVGIGFRFSAVSLPEEAQGVFCRSVSGLCGVFEGGDLIAVDKQGHPSVRGDQNAQAERFPAGCAGVRKAQSGAVVDEKAQLRPGVVQTEARGSSAGTCRKGKDKPLGIGCGEKLRREYRHIRNGQVAGKQQGTNRIAERGKPGCRCFDTQTCRIFCKGITVMEPDPVLPCGNPDIHAAQRGAGGADDADSGCKGIR